MQQAKECVLVTTMILLLVSFYRFVITLRKFSAATTASRLNYKEIMAVSIDSMGVASIDDMGACIRPSKSRVQAVAPPALICCQTL